MKILFLEDRASATEQIENYLRLLGEDKIFSAGNIYEANRILEENDIDCYVVDLNLPPNGQKKERVGSHLFTGWIWIVDVLIETKLNEAQKDKDYPIIIYSEFIDDFEQQYNNKIEKNSAHWEYFKKGEKSEKI